MASSFLRMDIFMKELEDSIFMSEPDPKAVKKQVQLMKDLFKKYAEKNLIHSGPGAGPPTEQQWCLIKEYHRGKVLHYRTNPKWTIRGRVTNVSKLQRSEEMEVFAEKLHKMARSVMKTYESNRLASMLVVKPVTFNQRRSGFLRSGNRYRPHSVIGTVEWDSGEDEADDEEEEEEGGDRTKTQRSRSMNQNQKTLNRRSLPPMTDLGLFYPQSDTEGPHTEVSQKLKEAAKATAIQLQPPPLHTAVEPTRSRSSQEPVQYTVLSRSSTVVQTETDTTQQQIKNLQEQVEALTRAVARMDQTVPPRVDQLHPSWSTPMSAPRYDTSLESPDHETTQRQRKLVQEKEQDVFKEMQKKKEKQQSKELHAQRGCDRRTTGLDTYGPATTVGKKQVEKAFISGDLSPFSEPELTNEEDRPAVVEGVPVVKAYPLRMTADNTNVYLPFTLKDIDGLMLKLPKLTQGAPAFFRALSSLTAHDKLCWTDVAAVITRATDEDTADKARTEVSRRIGFPIKTTTPYDKVRTELLHVMKGMYPPCIPEALMALKMKDGEDYFSYKQRAKALFHDAIGEPVRQASGNTVVFFITLVKGMPEAVKAHLADVVGLYSKTEEDFDKHCQHYVAKYLEEKEKESDDLRKMREAILKLQLEELKDEVEGKKSGNKSTSMMEVLAGEGSETAAKDLDSTQQLAVAIRLAMTQINAPPAFQTTASTTAPQVVPQTLKPAPVFIYNNGVGGCGHFARGREQRNAGRGNGQRNAQIFHNQCRRCYGFGHWARDCPQGPRQRGLQPNARPYQPSQYGAPAGDMMAQMQMQLTQRKMNFRDNAGSQFVDSNRHFEAY